MAPQVGGGRHYPSQAFTENGVAILQSIFYRHHP